jgi:glycine amidinotransferase/scyllo-inosamine-4-phosphate amidinotransferase 1
MINTRNEWDPLKSVVVGSAAYANWPSEDPVFKLEASKTTWTESPVPSGPVPQWIIDETEEDLEGLCKILTNLGVEVLRPDPFNFQAAGGLYNYCPRDRLLVHGSTVVDCAMMYPCRDQEILSLNCVTSQTSDVRYMPRNKGMTLDAANICRLGNTWLYLQSPSGNKRARLWLEEQFPEVTIEECNFYAGVHIDSTIVPLREGLVLLNAARVTEKNCPRVFDSWEKIWITDVVAQDFYQYPYASKWIAMNMLVVNPTTVIADAAQTEIITMLEARGITVIPHELRHSRTLGGGFHCVTLDLERTST